MTDVSTAWSDLHLEELREAKAILQNPSFVIRLTSTVGNRVESLTKELGKRLPAEITSLAAKSSDKALESVLQAALRTMKGDRTGSPRNRLHQAAVLGTGGVAGFFGLEALLLELPVTTLIMFRSIADIARANGENLAEPETQLNCVTVFALGSPKSEADEGAETSYYGVRYALARVTSDAVKYVAAHGTAGKAAPAMVRFISAISQRFGVVVSQKAAAQAIPAIGAIGGAVVNAIFISHFQDMARAHFTIRRLERLYGAERVREQYESLPDQFED